MDNFIKEISNVAKLPFNEIFKDFKLMMISNRALYVSNYIKILDYSDEKLTLKVYKNILEITGKDLYISQINKNEIIIKGIIFSCSLGGNNEGK